MSRAYNTHNFTLPVFCRRAVDGHAIYPSTTSSTFDMDQLVRIYRHYRKERLKITKLAKFESDMSETSEDIAPQNANVYRRLYGGGGEGWGWGHKLAPTIQTSIKYFQLCRAISLFGFILSLSNLTIPPILRRSFQWCRWIFANWSM